MALHSQPHAHTAFPSPLDSARRRRNCQNPCTNAHPPFPLPFCYMRSQNRQNPSTNARTLACYVLQKEKPKPPKPVHRPSWLVEAEGAVAEAGVRGQMDSGVAQKLLAAIKVRGGAVALISIPFDVDGVYIDLQSLMVRDSTQLLQFPFFFR